MNINYEISSQVEKYAKELKKEYRLSNYESLDLALKAEQNKLLKTAFVIFDNDSKPSALEAIAINLGQTRF